MHLPRFCHAIYAFVCGYFWLPCPICGRNFGGHESRHLGDQESSSVMTTWSEGLMVCTNCYRAAWLQNEQWFKEHPVMPRIYEVR